MIAVAFGIPGVGKSSITKPVVEKLGIERIHWGHIAFEIAKEKNIVDNIDMLRRQNLNIQKEIQSESVDRIVEQISKNPDRNYLIETHAALKTPQGYLGGLNQDSIEKIKPEVIIVYEAEPGHVYHRRMVDPTRDRSDDTTIDEVKLNLDITRHYAANFAVLAAGTLFIITNKEGDLDYAVGRTTEALGKFIN